MTSSSYTNTAIPKALAQEVDDIVDSGCRGFRSRQEFVVDAVRRYPFYFRGMDGAAAKRREANEWPVSPNPEESSGATAPSPPLPRPAHG